MNGWIETSLENVTDLITRGIPPKYVEDGGVCVVNQRCIREHKIDYETARRHCINTKAVKEDRYIRVGDVLINSTGVGTLGRVAQVREEPKEPTVVDTHVTILRPQSGLFHPDFLGFLLISLEEQLMGLGEGASGQTELSRTKIKQLKVSFPKSLSEQKRIVEILDEAFDGIAKATANAQRNLANAANLMRSIVDCKLDEIEKSASSLPLDQLRQQGRVITYGVIKLGDHVDDGVPCLRTSNVRWLSVDTYGMKRISSTLSQEYKRTVLCGGEVLVNVRGTLGGVAAVDNTMVGWNISREVAMVPTDTRRMVPKFLSYWIARTKSQNWLTGVLTGAAYTGINIEDLRTLSVCCPPLDVQLTISSNLDEALSESRSLLECYQTRLASLNDLKQSLLHKAFTGQLISSGVAPAVQKLESPMTANAKLTAQVIVLAHYRHVAAQRDKTFGHVKAQKILHLVESCANISLARSPIKDAAGPNDFAHMLRAEEWAESNDFFKFNKRDGGYSFQKLKGYNQLLSEAQERLKPFKQKLDKILGLLVPMDTQDAEVFATVHAAWNNLVVDRKPITDDAIIKEARDNWHQDKLKIPKAKFLKAIHLIRKEGLIPDGSAKYVPSHPQGKML